MPRKEYKTITVKLETQYKFLRVLAEAKKIDEKLDNSKFLEALLERYRRSK